MNCPYCRSKQSRYFLTKENYVHRRCQFCGSIFIAPQPSAATLRHYYQHAFDYQDGHKNEAVIRKRSQVILQTLRRFHPLAHTLCDVGCGYGFFLDEARRAGYQVRGQEPSLTLAAFARHTFTLSVTHQSIDSFSKKNPGAFDIVTCIHVIEHVPSPHSLVFRLSRLTAPGGIIYIETPNAHSALLERQRAQYSFIIPPVHLHLPSPMALIQLLPPDHISLHLSTYSYKEQAMGYLKSFFKHKGPKVPFPVSVNTADRPSRATVYRRENSLTWVRRKITYLLFDQLISRLIIPFLNRGDKGCVLALYIRKKT